MGETVHEEVKLSDIKLNPFRRLDLYPLNKMKIERLRSSIKKTDFWDNVVARKKDGYYELAYGHHRIEAVRKEKGPNARVRLIVRELSDEEMLRFMGLDNNEAYNASPRSMLENVSAVKSHFSGKAKSPKFGGVKLCKAGETTLCHRVHTFLNCPRRRVEDALAQLNAIERGDLCQEAIEALPTPHAAATLHLEVQKAKSVGRPLTPKTQVRFAKLATKVSAQDASRVIRTETMLHAHPRKHMPEQPKEFEDFISKTAQHGSTFVNDLKTMIEYKDDLNSEIYQRKFVTNFFGTVIADVQKYIAVLQAETPAASKPKKALPAG